MTPSLPTSMLKGSVERSAGAAVVVVLVVGAEVVVVLVVGGAVLLLVVVVVGVDVGPTVAVVDEATVAGGSDAPEHADNVRAVARTIAPAARGVYLIRTRSPPDPSLCKGETVSQRELSTMALVVSLRCATASGRHNEADAGPEDEPCVGCRRAARGNHGRGVDDEQAYAADEY